MKPAALYAAIACAALGAVFYTAAAYLLIRSMT